MSEIKIRNCKKCGAEIEFKGFTFNDVEFDGEKKIDIQVECHSCEAFHSTFVGWGDFSLDEE
jgi:hypothetical protein